MKGKIERDFPSKLVRLRTWLKALRIHQWSKNLLLFVPMILAHQYANIMVISDLVFSYLYMGAIASGTYLINDLSDLDADRKHKTKCRRPIASGAIGAGSALVVALAAITFGLIGAASISLNLLFLVAIYLALTLIYSLYVKRMEMLDVVTLGALYTLRILMGTVIINVDFSPWLLMFSLFFFLSLSLAKRYTEIIGADIEIGSDDKIYGRGYKISDGLLVLTFGVATSVVAVLILTLYVANEAFPVDTYANPQFLWFFTPIVLLWTMRIWLFSFRGEMDDDPVVFAIKDRVSWGLGLLVVLTLLAAIL